MGSLPITPTVPSALTACTPAVSLAFPPPNTIARPPSRAPAASCTAVVSAPARTTVLVAGSIRRISLIVCFAPLKPPRSSR